MTQLCFLFFRDDGSSAKAEQDTTMIVHQGDVGEYIELLQTTLSSEVDKFFNNGEITTAVLPVAEDTVSLAGEVIQEVGTFFFSRILKSTIILRLL